LEQIQKLASEPENKKLKGGSLELVFEVAGTKEIKTWIMGFGSLAKVLEPAFLGCKRSKTISVKP
jgi:hypothetical protein